MHPFLDPSTLSDDEIQERLNSLQKRMYSAHFMGMSFELKNQLQSLMEVLEMEMQNRFATQMQKAWDAQFPDIIESEPDLRPGAEKAKPDPKSPKKKKEGADRPTHAPSFNKVYKQK